MNNLEVKQITVTDEFMASSVWQKYEEDIALEECAICEITDTISFFYQDLKLTIIHPDKEFSDDNINNNSIVIAADFGEFEILFTGDLELEGEEYVMQKYSKFLPADFLKVGHHGSKTASSCEFVSEVEPEFAFISTSLQNRFDFPHSKTISTFSYLNEKLFVSGRDGAVQVIVLEDKIIIKSFKSDKSYQKNL